ncbi:TRAP-type mannitol/chloroaromatic compound transport system permease small subunit [Rhodobium orientis]|uniref:TRAP transporter small permease protein n=1 Tax=Rhodobium orientis TaxID=34017 RepID=A0A327JK41_9HYPH|nr:TRAP transporter small permease subunit [Rhodobium orientis]MBB4302875.1 TRAP-type mannitol/chloroaromatic compound transport system permease small subunit [Rhodobium orientis]MBK5949436.1 C4-dicarboxylate ABC transporter permease [Rhodobium orientis]RAI26006.1 C4-dicarboxylate ABC transporter permease [Rhodobium orientis]
MRGLAQAIDAVNSAIGKFVAWFALFIVLLQFAIVVGRYVFGVGSIWAQELIVYMHAFNFMLAAAYTLRNDGHVRVDIFYREAAPAKKALVNLLGAAFLLIPVCILIVWVSRDYVAGSWAVFEGSKETSGIQGVFLLKTAIMVFAVQMGLQGVSMILHSLLALSGDTDELVALSHHHD